MHTLNLIITPKIIGKITEIETVLLIYISNNKMGLKDKQKEQTGSGPSFMKRHIKTSHSKVNEKAISR